MRDDLCLIGEITGVHGIRGDVKIRSYAQHPEDIAAYPLTDATGARGYKILSFRIHHNALVASLEGVTDRNAAERLIGAKLYVSRETLPEPDENEFYYDELIGLEVRRNDGTLFGRVTGVDNFGAGDLVDIERADTKSVEMFAFTHAVFPEINLDKKYLVIEPPEILRADPAEEAQDKENEV